MGEKTIPLIFDEADGQQLRINTVNTYLKNKFRRKIVILSLTEMVPKA